MSGGSRPEDDRQGGLTVSSRHEERRGEAALETPVEHQDRGSRLGTERVQEELRVAIDVRQRAVQRAQVGREGGRRGLVLDDPDRRGGRDRLRQVRWLACHRQALHGTGQ